jgi:hypothetical protein
MWISAFRTFNAARQRMYKETLRFDVEKTRTMAYVYLGEDKLCEVYDLSEKVTAKLKSKPLLTLKDIENRFAGQDYDQWDRPYNNVLRALWLRYDMKVTFMDELAVVTAYATYHDFKIMVDVFTHYCCECCNKVPPL